jgi:divalent metal cation (Fe/Co/Zn/Cd) transporter
VLQRYQGEYISIQQIRSRRTGKHIFVELFISFPPLQTFAKVHDISTKISQEVQATVAGAEVIVIPLVIS